MFTLSCNHSIEHIICELFLRKFLTYIFIIHKKIRVRTVFAQSQLRTNITVVIIKSFLSLFSYEDFYLLGYPGALSGSSCSDGIFLEFFPFTGFMYSFWSPRFCWKCFPYHLQKKKNYIISCPYFIHSKRFVWVSWLNI